MIFQKKVGVPSFVFLLIVMLVLASVSLLLYFSDEEPTKWTSIYSGLFTAFFVASIQIFVSYYEHKKLTKYEKMGVLDIVKQRRGKGYYGEMLSSSKKNVSLMGTTASRFLEDFANKSVDENDILLQALSRGVSVHILIPKKNCLDEGDYANYKTTKDIADSVKGSHGDKFEIRYFDSTPAHSILIIDDKCIIGPVFPNIESKHSPAITLRTDSEFAKPYIKYFNEVWENSDSNDE